MNRSSTVGMPNLRTPPSGFGISTLFTGCGLYVPFEQLFPEGWPVLFQVIIELAERNSVDTRTTFVRLDPS